MTSRQAPREGWPSRAYRVALHAFPAEFRERWGDDMRRTFLDRLREADTPRRLVAREFANVLSAGFGERLHSNSRRFRMVHLQDIRYAFRLLFRSPGFTLLTVLVLAGGLGVSTFTFSFLHAAMIRPLPLGEGERIVRLTRLEQGRRRPVDAVDLAALRATVRSVEGLGGYTRTEVMLGRTGERRVLTATSADPVLFSVARTPALRGRTLLPSDAEPGAEAVIVLAHRTWEVAFGFDRDVVGSLVTINGVSTRVVGVMPEDFGFPVTQDAWLPLPATIGETVQPGVRYVSVFARLAAGATPQGAASEATGVLQRATAARDTTNLLAERTAMAVESFPAAQIGDERTIVFSTLNVLAALILLLALVNVTTLLTARANERARETAVRLALGASTGRLVVQGLWEGVILCVFGGFVGTAAASWGLQEVTRWTQANMADSMAFWWVWRMDHVTLLSAGAFVTASIAVLGSVVSLRALRTNVREVIQDGSARSGSRREGRLARNVSALQITTVTLLMFIGVLSGVMAQRVTHLDPGYDPKNLLQVTLEPSADRFPAGEARARVFAQVEARLASHGALGGALLRTRLADKGDRDDRFAVRNASEGGTLPGATIVATLGAMSTLGIELREGRLPAASDDASRAPVVAISQALAARHWRGRSPLGEEVRLAGLADSLAWRTVVGIVSDIPYGNELSRDRSADAIYVPLLQAGVEYTDVIVRTRQGEVAGREALHDVLGAIDPLLVPGYVHRTEEVIRKSGLLVAGMTKLFGGCFVFALLLAVAGSYGLMSRSIGLRTREIGVRRALGASDAMVARLLLTQGARQLGAGALIAAPLLALVGVAATKFFPLGAVLTMVTALLVSISIIAVILAATWLPTRKVLRVAVRDALWRD